MSTNKCHAESFTITDNHAGVCHRMTGNKLTSVKVTKSGDKPELTFLFSPGDTYPHRWCNGWGCEWGSKAWTTKLIMQCDPEIETYKRTNFA